MTKRSIALFVLVAALPITVALAPVNKGATEAVLAQVFNIVGRSYVDSLGTNKLYEKAARGLVQQLHDPYSELMSPADLARFEREAIRGAYAGIGVALEVQGGKVIVARVYPNTPAIEHGLLAGDVIVGVDSSRDAITTIEQVQHVVLGRPGESVTLRVERDGVPTPMAISMVRRAVHVPSVPFSMMLPGSIGYVPLQSISETSAQETGDAFQSVISHGAKGVILDIRGNGGGIVEQAVAISNLFLAQNRVVLTQRERATAATVYSTTVDPVDSVVPVAVLIDDNTASAAEIIAGALQDHDRAVVVGSRSFGKGLVQSVFRLDGGWALKLTTGHWYTPSGRLIHRNRTLLADGELSDGDTVAAMGDSTAKKTYRSDAGRVLHGGGGIVPDIDVKSDSAPPAVVALSKEVGAKAPAFREVLESFALAHSHGIKPDFTVTPEWHAAFVAQLEQRGVRMTPATLSAAGKYVDELVARRVASIAFGDSSAFRRDAQADKVLQRAVTALTSGTPPLVTAIQKRG